LHETADSSRPLLAIDLGVRRTGLARSNPERTIALGLETFEVGPGRSLKAHLMRLHRELPLGGIVLGLPLHLDGRPGALAGRVRRLGEWIRLGLHLPVAYVDERLTSAEAAERVAEAPVRVRREKGVRDRLAAQIILQEFLDAGCPFSGADPDREDDGRIAEAGGAPPEAPP
jgi:putative Holliday junction resolvase